MLKELNDLKDRVEAESREAARGEVLLNVQRSLRAWSTKDVFALRKPFFLGVFNFGCRIESITAWRHKATPF